MNHAPEVHPQHPTPIVERLGDDRVERRDPGVVAQHVDGTESVEGGLSQVLQVGGDTHVGDDGEDLPLHGVGHGIEGDGVDIGQHDGASGGGEGASECGTDAARRAGDYGDRTVRELHVCLHSLPVLLSR